MQSDGDLGGDLRRPGERDDADRAAQRDRPRVDRHQRTSGGLGDVGGFRAGAAEVRDVGGAFIRRQRDAVRADADLGGADDLTGGQVDLGERVRHREGHVGEAPVLGQRDAQRVDVLGAAGDVDRRAPGEFAVGRDLGHVEVRAAAGDDRGLAVGGDREPMHGAAALGDGELGLRDQLEGVRLEGR